MEEEDEEEEKKGTEDASGRRRQQRGEEGAGTNLEGEPVGGGVDDGDRALEGRPRLEHDLAPAQPASVERARLGVERARCRRARAVQGEEEEEE